MNSTQSKPTDRHIIWSDLSLDPDDWRDDYKDFLEINGLDDDPNDENELYKWMVETNEEYLADERTNLNIQLSQPIIVVGDLGLWHGRVMGYKMIDSGNIKDCLYADTDMTEWYVDKYGDFRADAVHHDGTNHYLYRVIKDSVSDTQLENLQNKLATGRATRADITRITKRLGDEIAKVYRVEHSETENSSREREVTMSSDVTIEKINYAKSIKLPYAYCGANRELLVDEIIRIGILAIDGNPIVGSKERICELYESQPLSQKAFGEKLNALFAPKGYSPVSLPIDDHTPYKPFKLVYNNAGLQFMFRDRNDNIHI